MTCAKTSFPVFITQFSKKWFEIMNNMDYTFKSMTPKILFLYINIK